MKTIDKVRGKTSQNVRTASYETAASLAHTAAIYIAMTAVAATPASLAAVGGAALSGRIGPTIYEKLREKGSLRSPIRKLGAFEFHQYDTFISLFWKLYPDLRDDIGEGAFYKVLEAYRAVCGVGDE